MNVEADKFNKFNKITPPLGSPLSDVDLFRLSPFLSNLVADGVWHETRAGAGDLISFDRMDGRPPSLQDFKRDFRLMLDDPEAALIALRRLRIRTLLGLGRADIEEKIKHHQLRARLRAMSEAMVQGAWWLAEQSLRTRYLHPIIFEKRNINPPLAICSLSRLGAGDPMYTTGPAPIFIHSRAAEFAPALSQKDLEQARRSGKEWLPAREYFNRLARRTMSYLSAPDPAGKGFDHMAEDFSPGAPPILPGTLVVLYASFEEHFLRRPIGERLALIRLRFVVGQEKLGKAVERAAREVLLKTASDLDTRLNTWINNWYRDRAKAEGVPLVKGGLLDIERVVRMLQFKMADREGPGYLVSSPLKALDQLVKSDLIGSDERLVLSRSYSWQWYVSNRLALLGRRESTDWKAFQKDKSSVKTVENMDNILGLPEAAVKTARQIKAAKSALAEILKRV